MDAIRFRNTLITLIFLSTQAVYASDFTHKATASVVSQYVWRGLDVNQEDPAIQADYTLKHKEGLLFSAWISNYDNGADDGIELDLIAGYAHKINNQLTLRVGLTEYAYSGDTDASTEFNLGANYNNWAATYYNDVDLDTNYLEVNYKLPLNKKMEMLFHAGHNKPDEGKNSTDLAATFSFKLNPLTLFATYSTNSLDTEGAENYLLAGATVTF